MEFELNKKYYFRNNFNGLVETNSTVIITLEDNTLVFSYDIKDDVIFSPYKVDNEDIWNHDVVEVFISFNGKREAYYEYELSPYNVRFYGIIDNPTLCKPNLTKLDCNFKSSVEITDTGYKAKIYIDLPEDSTLDDVLLNVFNVDSDGADVSYYSINPTLNPTFHLGTHLCKIVK